MVDPKIVDFSLIDPQTVGRYTVLGRFTLILHPFRIRNCSLVQLGDEYTVWYPSKGIRVKEDAAEAFAECAVEAYDQIRAVHQ